MAVKKDGTKKAPAKKVNYKKAFDPNKNYEWQPTAEVPILGIELHVIHNTLSGIFKGEIPQAQMFVLLSECHKITSKIIERGVELGIVHEKE